MNNIYNETKFILKKYGIHANKSLGQNFLINEEVINQIIEKAEIDENDLVIEIGPGLGTLTSRLLEKAGKVICVELDDRMISILEDRFKLYDNFELIHNDVLKVDLNKIIEENLENSNLKTAKIVANLPYYITTPIIMKLLDSCITKYETIIDMKDKSKIVGFLIHSWEGAEPQFLGDDYYIIKGIKGEAYPCEGNVFRDSYEEKK